MKKIYLLKDSQGGTVHAQLMEDGELTFAMKFPSPVMDERELYAIFAALGWEVKHEEFRPVYDAPSEIYIPEGTTFH